MPRPIQYVVGGIKRRCDPFVCPSVHHRRQRRRSCMGRDPQYLTCRGHPVLTTPNILTSVLFFSHGTHESQKTTHPECTISHHFEKKNSKIFWEGIAPPQTPPPSPPTLRRLDSRVSALDLRPPQCFSGVDAHVSHATSSKRYIRYDTIRDAILTCARKPT